MIPMMSSVSFFYYNLQMPSVLEFVYGLCLIHLFLLHLGDFVYKVSTLSPTRHFIVHSRKALLGGISPADNRRIPPLKYVFTIICLTVIVF